MFKKFRKKPVVIDAFHYTKETDPGFLIRLGFYEDKIGSVIIPTLEGSLRANWGDWIIKGTEGEFYPCKENIFNKIYEKKND